MPVKVPTREEAEAALQRCGDGDEEILAYYLFSHTPPDRDLILEIARALLANGNTRFRLKFEQPAAGRPKANPLDGVIRDADLFHLVQEEYRGMAKPNRKRAIETVAKRENQEWRAVREAYERARRVIKRSRV